MSEKHQQYGKQCRLDAVWSGSALMIRVWTNCSGISVQICHKKQKRKKEEKDTDSTGLILASILRKSTGRHRPVSYPDGPMRPDIDLRRMLTGIVPIYTTAGIFVWWDHSGNFTSMISLYVDRTENGTDLDCECEDGSGSTLFVLDKTVDKKGSQKMILVISANQMLPVLIKITSAR